jgi:hypothetical protein
MTKTVWILLTITFLDKDDQPLYFDGWSSTIQPNMETCLQRKDFLEAYMNQKGVLPDIIDSFVVTCSEHSA